MGALSAILLNLFLNILAGKRNFVDEVEPTMQRPERLSIEQVNGLSEHEFVEAFGPLFQGEPWIAPEAARERPFDSLYSLRHAFQSSLFDAPAERQLELIRAYPDLAAKIALGPGSTRDQASAGLNRLSPEEYERFDALNEAYRAKFGFPFVICVRENTKETIFASFERRLENDPKQERVAALVEIAKIANMRLLDQVEEPDVAEAPPAGPRGGARQRCRPRARRERGGHPVVTAVADVDAMSEEAFVATFGSLFEHSPWVAREAWRRRPFGSRGALHAAFEDAMRSAPHERQLALIRAHPELAGREAEEGELTEESSREQASAGLDRLSPAEHAPAQGAQPALQRALRLPADRLRARAHEATRSWPGAASGSSARPRRRRRPPSARSPRSRTCAWRSS